MRARISDAPNESRLLVEGEVDRGNIGELVTEFRALLSSTEGPIILDLTRVDYIDSAGVCAFYDLAAKTDGDRVIEIIGTRPNVRRILYLAGLTVLEGVHVALDGIGVDQASPPGRDQEPPEQSEVFTAERVFPSRLDQLESVRRFVEELGVRAGLDDARIFNLKVAASEASANAVEHGLSSGDLRVAGSLRPDRLTVTVSHPGDFRPRAPGDPERFHRGMGLPLMLNLTDEVTIGCKPGMGTSVSLSMLLAC